MFFWAPESFRFRNENFLLQIKTAKRLFTVIACENVQGSAFITISVNANILKKSAKNQIFTALGALEDFEIFDTFMHHFNSIAVEQLLVTIAFQKKNKKKFHSTLLSSTRMLVYSISRIG